MSPPIPLQSQNPALAWAYYPVFDSFEQSDWADTLFVWKVSGLSLISALGLAYLAHHREYRRLTPLAKLSWFAGAILLLVGSIMAAPREATFIFFVILTLLIVIGVVVFGGVYVFQVPLNEPAPTRSSDGRASGTAAVGARDGEVGQGLISDGQGEKRDLRA